MRQKLLDENGNPTIVVQSTIPGLIIVPKENESVEPISSSAYEEHIEEVKAEVVKFKPRNIAKELDDLKAENELLKTKLDEVKTNVDKIRKP